MSDKVLVRSHVGQAKFTSGEIFLVYVKKIQGEYSPRDEISNFMEAILAQNIARERYHRLRLRYLIDFEITINEILPLRFVRPVTVFRFFFFLTTDIHRENEVCG